VRVVAVVALRENDDTRGHALSTTTAYHGDRHAAWDGRNRSRGFTRATAAVEFTRGTTEDRERASEVDERATTLLPSRGSASPLLLLRCVLLLFFLLHLHQLLLSLLRLSLPHVLYP